MLTKEEWQGMFEQMLVKDPFCPQPIAMMQVIQDSLHLDDSTTLQELIARMRFVRESLCSSKSASVCIKSAGELYTLYVTRAPTAIENAESLNEVREILKSRSKDLLETYKKVTHAIGKISQEIFQEQDAPIILTHSWNQCVLQSCIEAKHHGHNIRVFVTEGRPLAQGDRMVKDLRAGGVPADLIVDAAMAYYAQKSSIALLGAEAVCPNGGIIARIGTAAMAAIAHVMDRRVYVLVESYRLTTDLMPLNNNSLQLEDLYGPMATAEQAKEIPRVDYTPPEHIDCFYTDIGQLQSGILHEIINMMFT